MARNTSFGNLFHAATGFPPFAWQERLYEALRTGQIPDACDIPTGLGKTSVIVIWLLALIDALRANEEPLGIPRRLVYVVDRRVVVDQATKEAEGLLERIQRSEALKELRDVLEDSGVLTGDKPIALSTLRGQYADNRLWEKDPARPAIIVGTVDMIGSRLLFSGYGGLGRYRRSLHAGLLGQDALIVVDEAHLSPPFVQTLLAVRQHIGSKPLRPFGVMLLSATQAAGRTSEEHKSSERIIRFGDDPADLRNSEGRKRWTARKILKLESFSDGEKVEAQADKIVQRAVELAGKSYCVVIFADTVELVNKIAERLKRVAVDRVLELTGEMRGRERDKFTEGPLFRLFQRRSGEREPQSQPTFLVTTASGEVGINFDADHAVCDLVTLDRMIQRFGRVNRFGDGQAQIHVVSELSNSERKQHQEEDTEAATFRLLHKLRLSDGGFDASPCALAELRREAGDEYESALPVPPPCPPLDEARLDDWALTTLSTSEFPRPQVSYWLRGLIADERPYTHFCWRADLNYAINESDAEQMARVMPLESKERAQVLSYRATKLLKQIASKTLNEREAYAVLLFPNGEWKGHKIEELQNHDDDLESLIANCTVYLPTAVGGLDDGVPVYDSSARTARVDDVAEPKEWRRFLLRSTEDGVEAYHLLASGEVSEQAAAGISEKALFSQITDEFNLKYVCTSGQEPDFEEAQEQLGRIAYFSSLDSDVSSPVNEDVGLFGKQKVLLDEHNSAVEAIAIRLAKCLGLSKEFADAVIQAARGHDDGKALKQWQRAIGNFDPTPLAKCDKPGFHFRETGGYRHEFGSMMKFLDKSGEIAHGAKWDLILHLIAAHHGHSRPLFKHKAYELWPPIAVSAQKAFEAAERFCRLQREFGWWQLAYLEALLKCADAIASTQHSSANL